MRAVLALRIACLGAVFGMTACAAAPDEDNTPLALAGSAWALEAADAGPLQAAAAGSEVTLEFAAGKASGNGGCNRYFADYTLDGDTLVFGPVGATKRGCEDSRMLVERSWFAALSGKLEVSRSGDRLHLRDAAGTRFTLVATPAAVDAK